MLKAKFHSPGDKSSRVFYFHHRYVRIHANGVAGRARGKFEFNIQKIRKVEFRIEVSRARLPNELYRK